MPNLENLRKQAKRFLRWHRERRWTVATQIRNTLPGYAGLEDREVFERPFKLADAQELVARQAGFESWERLRTVADSEPAEVAESSQLLDAKPFLFVSDLAAAARFYTSKLGFEVAFTYGEPAFYAEIHRDGAQLALRHADDPFLQATRAHRREEELLAATIMVDWAKPLYQEFDAAGVPFFQKLRTEPYGVRSFIVEDPYGNLIGFEGS